ncbi:unnamed protein product [Orchesella dallaii]|uniref:WH2 domain-containing protein n=1 Tax=Orchesella dallaii TaxID=48710 RepID=A0ABP1RAM0_9HEXA
MNYEMASGPPKLSAPSTRRVPSTINTTKKPTLLRSDAAGKALEKYGESQKKLQGLVNNFTQKVESSSSTKPTTGSTTRRGELELESSTENNNSLVRGTPQLSSLASQSTLNSRRDNAAAASGVISRSMRTIGRASNVAQRLGTLMSRVALRNETYEYEKEQEAKQNSISVPNEDLPSAIASNPIKRFNANTNISPVSLMMKQSVGTSARKNPYETNSDQELDMGRPNIPPGVSKLDSSQFDKYVEEMKKVAEKAADSFEKFKQRKDDTELVSFSEDEEDSDAEYSYGSDKAYEDAAAAAEIAAQQEKKVERKQMVQMQKPSARMNVKTAQTSTRKTDSHTSPRERGAISRIMNRSSGSYIRDDEKNNNSNNNTNSGDFKFVPDMSYTDQMMLQKLRKLKEQEGWGDSNQRIEMGDGPDTDEIKTMIKRVGKGMPTETERVGVGPSSLNSVIRSRMKNSKINASKK